MQPSLNFFNLIKFSEGFRSSPYMDNRHGRVYTIGWGTTKYPNGKPVTAKDKSITRDQALEYLINDVDWAIKAIEKYVTVPLNQNQFDALLDFVYNIGEPSFKSSTLLKKINSKAPNKEIVAQFKRWIFDNGVKLDGLVTRRENECELYEKI